MWELLCKVETSTFDSVADWLKEKDINIKGLTLYKGKIEFEVYYKRGR